MSRFRRYRLLDAEAARTSNRVGFFVLFSALGLALIVHVSGFDLRNHAWLHWLTEFHTVRLQAGISVNHQREALAVWAYLCLLAPFSLLYLLVRSNGISAESDRHLLLCTAVFGALAGFATSLAWGLGLFETILSGLADTTPKTFIAKRIRTSLLGMTMTAALLHFCALFSVTVLLRVWWHRLRIN